MIPRATYRLQLSTAFPLDRATKLVPYFSKLGISHLYVSPILKARKGSAHGYDVVDPTVVNPELGGERALRRLSERLHAENMALLVDIVPNHMAASTESPWWNDVLRRGKKSPFAPIFDIDWNHPDADTKGRVVYPILDRPLSDALAGGTIRLERTQADAWLRCGLVRLPLSSARDIDRLRARAGSKQYLDQLTRLLKKQNYRLVWWRLANDTLNWRRFFDINELVGVRVEDPWVFAQTHGTLFRLYANGIIDGFRVDHIDGLADPNEYCRKLRTHLRRLERHRPSSAPQGPAYIVVEKILAEEEDLPSDWGVNGTTGYDFMDQVSGLLHDPKGESALTALWHTWSGRPHDFEAEEVIAREELIGTAFAGRLDAVTATFWEIARAERITGDLSALALKGFLGRKLLAMRRYRSYWPELFPAGVIGSDARLAGALEERITDTLERWARESSVLAAPKRRAFGALQQLSSAIAAKAVEDTAFYRYGRLLSRTDVGFNPRHFSLKTSEFHRLAIERARKFPYGMLVTATHDHKRGEDTRARLAVLSEIPRLWTQKVNLWRRMNADFRGSQPSISAADEIILYQTIIGAWPFMLSPKDQRGIAAFASRVRAWQRKAIREAKLHTSWTEPNDSYERSADRFARLILRKDSAFVADAWRFIEGISAAGAANGLSQLILKLTYPGVPDVYQGTEFWDLSLVDPDNRSPVDFARRQAHLKQELDITKLASRWKTGEIKQALLACTIGIRDHGGGVIKNGSYTPLHIVGTKNDSIIAFMRGAERLPVVTVATIRPWRTLKRGNLGSRIEAVRDLRIRIPDEGTRVFRNIFTGDTIKAYRGAIRCSDVLSTLPVAVLVGEKD